MDVSLLWLLPAGVVIGWLIADKFKKPPIAEKRPDFPQAYFKGLNYLINEEQDKAISVFTEMLEKNPEMVETHLALGALFRRRGESSRAISIHKALIEKETLSAAQRVEALRELGRDYMKAGMLDRAISPLQELLAFPEHKQDALTLLAQIYDQEQDWDQAIDAVESLATLTGDEKWQTVLAHYFCEKAKLAIEAQSYPNADKHLQQALQHSPECVRASLLKAKALQAQGDHAQAVTVFQEIEAQNPLYLPEVLTPMLESFHEVAGTDSVIEYLRGLLDRNPSTSLVLTLVDKVRSAEGLKEAEKLLIGILQHRPSVRGLEFLIALNLDKPENLENKARLKSLKKMMAKLQEEKPAYQCSHCGFQAQHLHWQCPGCRHWSTIAPIVGVAGE